MRQHALDVREVRASISVEGYFEGVDLVFELLDHAVLGFELLCSLLALRVVLCQDAALPVILLLSVFNTELLITYVFLKVDDGLLQLLDGAFVLEDGPG